MTTLESLRAEILALIPRDYHVAASDIVATLSHYPAKAIWPVLVVLAMDGVITTDRPGACDGRAFVRRLQ